MQNPLLSDPVFEKLSRLAKVKLWMADITTFDAVRELVRSGRKQRGFGKRLMSELAAWVGPPYRDPKERAREVVDAFLAGSVDSHFTMADNAIFAIEACGLISKALLELAGKNHVLAEMLSE